MSTGPWRTPSGTAPVVAFRSHDELLDAVIDHVARAAELAIAQRVRAGEISDRGDHASTYYPDPPRIHTMVHGATEPAPALDRASLELGRREQGLLGRLAASPYALGRAFARWELTDDDRRIALALVAAALSARVSRLLAVAGGDPTAAAVAAEALAALIAPGDLGVRRLADRVHAGPLEALALVHVGRLEVPFARRWLAPAPRLLELAFDRLALDPGCGAVAIDGDHRAVGPAVRDAVRAVVHRGVHPTVGALAIDHDAIGALAAAASEEGRGVLLAPVAAAIDPLRRAVLVREALLLDAALALELDGQGGVFAGAAIEAVARRVPTFLVYRPDAPPPRLQIASVSVPIAAPRAAEVEAAISRALGPGAASTPASHLPHHPQAIARAARALIARGIGDPAALAPAIAEQILPVEPAGALRLEDGPAPFRGEEIVDRVVARWRALDAPRRLSVLISGARGLGKARLPAVVAARLNLQAFLIDRATPIAPALVEAIDAGAAVGVLRDLTEEEIRGLRSKLWWARSSGLLIATTIKRLEPGDTSDFDLQFRLEPPTARERAVLWSSALAARGAVFDAGALHDLARFPLSEHRITALVRAATEFSLSSLVAAIQRELGVVDKSLERSP